MLEFTPGARRTLSLFLLLGIITMTVMFKVEAPLLLGMNPDWDRKVHAYRWLLHVHAVLGCVALFAAPAQYFPQLRRRHLQAHRVLGRIYVGAVLISAPIGMYIALVHLRGSESDAAAVQALAWLGTTLIALSAAVGKRLAAHQCWMVRSYALTFSFVISRFTVDVLNVELSPVLGGNSGLIWACTCIALMMGTAWRYAAVPRTVSTAATVAE